MMSWIVLVGVFVGFYLGFFTRCILEGFHNHDRNREEEYDSSDKFSVE